MKKITIIILSTIIISLIIVFCFCSKEPMKVPLKQEKGKYEDRVSDNRHWPELIIYNYSGSQVTFVMEPYNSDVWDRDYKFTSSYRYQTKEVADSSETVNCKWQINHVRVPDIKQGEDNFAYSKYKIYVQGRNEYVRINYLDTDYEGSGENYVEWDIYLREVIP